MQYSIVANMNMTIIIGLCHAEDGAGPSHVVTAPDYVRLIFSHMIDLYDL